MLNNWIEKNHDKSQTLKKLATNNNNEHWLNESVIQKVEMWPSNTWLGLNIFRITELIITNLFCPDIKGAASDVLRRTLLLLQQAE